MNIEPVMHKSQPQSSTHGMADSGSLSDMDGMVRPELFDNAADQIKQQIYYEQTCGLFTISRYAGAYTFLFSTLCVAILWSFVPHVALLTWYGVIVCLSILRHFVCLQFEKRKPPVSEIALWVRCLWMSTVSVGIAWSGLVWVSWSANETVVAGFITLILTSQAYGSYGTLGVYPRFFLGFSVPAAIGLMVLFAHGGGANVLMILLVIVLIEFGMGMISIKGGRAWRNSFVLVHKHHDLSQEHRQKSTILSTILHSISDGVLTVDRQGLVTYVNPAAERMTGLALKDFAGKKLSEGFLLKDDAIDGQQVNLAEIFEQVRESVQLPGELTLTSIRVSAISVEVTISPLLYTSIEPVNGYIVTLRDVTSARMLTRDLSHQALHDSLTGLLNRRGFEARLKEVMHRNASSPMAYSLCYIDLDRFKAINDSCGHLAGDQLLQQVVQVMQKRVREMDAFARLGGDEFAILFRGCAIDKASSIATGICQSVDEFRFSWEGKEFSVGASMGVVQMAANDSVVTLIETADRACYCAKKAGRGRVYIDARS